MKNHIKGLLNSIQEYFRRIGRNFKETAAFGTLYAFFVYNDFICYRELLKTGRVGPISFWFLFTLYTIWYVASASSIEDADSEAIDAILLVPIAFTIFLNLEITIEITKFTEFFLLTTTIYIFFFITLRHYLQKR